MSLNVIPFPGRVPQWTFAERARKVRRDLGYTQQQMSDALEVGLKAYSAWESGKNTPADLPDIAKRFEEASGVSRIWFLGWADAPQQPSPGTPVDSSAARKGIAALAQSAEQFTRNDEWQAPVIPLFEPLAA